jgi:hypothetical protein
MNDDHRWPHRNPPDGIHPLSVACPWAPCRAPAGRGCYNCATKKPLNGHHPSRIDAAAAAAVNTAAAQAATNGARSNP